MLVLCKCQLGTDHHERSRRERPVASPSLGRGSESVATYEHNWLLPAAATASLATTTSGRHCQSSRPVMSNLLRCRRCCCSLPERKPILFMGRPLLSSLAKWHRLEAILWRRWWLGAARSASEIMISVNGKDAAKR